jgi:hypothetical protein
MDHCRFWLFPLCIGHTLISCTIYHSVDAVYIIFALLAVIAFLILPRLKRGLGPLSFGPASPGAFWGIVHPVGRARISWGVLYGVFKEGRPPGDVEMLLELLLISTPIVVLYTTINELLPCLSP